MDSRVCEQCGQQSDETTNGLCRECQSIHAQTLAPADEKSSGETAQQMTGETFGEYELIEEIARGGMGVIYKARHRKLNRIVAIKMILSGRFSSTEELQRFHIEAEAAAKLDHPGIVPVYDIGEVDGQPFFAMKFIDGQSLAEHIGPLKNDPRNAIQLLVKVASAVHHAHQRGVLHRDLKPANILIDGDGEPLITDLGLAKNEQSNSNLTNTGAVLGTPAYMPPEQASGKGTVTTAADVYSLGAIMYELLTGKPPYQGNTAIDTVMQVLEGSPKAPHLVKQDVNRDLSMICMKLMEPNPDARYSSAAHVAADMNSWLEGRSLSIKHPSIVERTKRWFRNNRRLAFTGLAVAVGILITLPFALDLVASQEFAGVYDRFPDSERPRMFSLNKLLPEWMGFGAALFLVLMLWPSIGWLVVRITGPKSLLKAMLAGLRTALFLCVIIGLFMGWLVVGRTVAGSATNQTRALAEAIWPSTGDKTTEQRQSAVENLYPGLDKIPVNERALVVAQRIEADQVATAPLAMGAFFVIFGMLSVPVLFGTAISFMLLNRKQNFVIGYVRYMAAWWAILLSIALGISTLSGQQELVKLAISATIAWLILRRWKRSEPIQQEAVVALSSVK